MEPCERCERRLLGAKFGEGLENQVTAALLHLEDNEPRCHMHVDRPSRNSIPL